MAAFKKTLNIILIAYCCILLFSRCANQLSPPGGEIDRTPPQIIELTPKDGAVNYKGRSFEITFSEYVDKNSVKDNIFISPKIPGELEYDWSGRTLEVIFPDSLKANTTYSVTIGTDVADLNNRNKMAEAFNFSFSTGGKIDSCKISGKVYDRQPAGVMVFAYKDKGDTLDVSRHIPDYISQVGKNGNYLLTGLGYGDYLVFAMRDKLRDYIYKGGDDQIGIPAGPVFLKNDSSKISGLDYFLLSEDTVKPHINKVLMTDKYHLMLEFSKNIDSSKLKPENFFIIDSTTQVKTELKYFYKGQGKTDQFFLSFKDSVNNKGQLYVTVTNLIDLKGNKLDFEAASFTYNSRPDTSAAKVIKINGQYPPDMLDYETPEIFVQFDDGFDNNIPAGSVSVLDSKGKSIPVKINNLDNSSFIIGFSEKIKPKSELMLQLELKNFKDVSGKTLDSLYKKKFTIINDIDFSGASGTVISSDTTGSVYVVLEKAETDKKTYTQKTDKKGNFDIKKVVPGKYLVWSYIDKDKNKAYSKGKVKPFEFSEKFKFYSDTLNLRARWPVGDIRINIDK